MKKLYIIVPIIILICIGGKIGYNYYEKNKEYERTMIEANNAMKSKDYQTVLNTLMYAKSLKKESKEIIELEQQANLEIKNNENIERAKALFNENKHEQAIDILEKIENNDEAKKLLKQVQTDYNNKLAEEERKRKQAVFAENFSKLPRAELEKAADTINKNLTNATLKYIKDFKLNPSDLISITVPLKDDIEYANGRMFTLRGDSVSDKEYSILDKKWSELPNFLSRDEFEIDYQAIENSKENIDYDDTVSNTIKTLIDKIHSADKQILEDNSSVDNSDFLLELNIDNDDFSSDNIKSLIKNIRKGVDELVDGEIKRLQEISNQSNGDLDYDKLKYELHPGTYDRINIKFSKDSMEDDKVIVSMDFNTTKTGGFYCFNMDQQNLIYSFTINSKEIVDILETINVYCR